MSKSSKQRSGGAQVFVDLATQHVPGYNQKHFGKWLESKGHKRRGAIAFLNGTEDSYSEIHLLSEYLAEHSDGRKEFHQSLFYNHSTPPYIQDFVLRNRVFSGFIESVGGGYRCVRPGATVLQSGESWSIGHDDNVNTLDIKSHGPESPGSFSYKSPNENGGVDEWVGYAVASHPFLYLLGLCAEGKDAAYFVLRRHPEPEFADRILVGMQSLLLLRHPPKTGDPHALSRPIAAIKVMERGYVEAAAKAQQWIEDSRKEAGQTKGGLLIRMGRDDGGKL